VYAAGLGWAFFCLFSGNIIKIFGMRNTEGFVPEYLIESLFANVELIQCMALVTFAAAFSLAKETESSKKAVIGALCLFKNFEPIVCHYAFAKGDNLSEKEYLHSDFNIQKDGVEFSARLAIAVGLFIIANSMLPKKN